MSSLLEFLDRPSGQMRARGICEEQASMLSLEEYTSHGAGCMRVSRGVSRSPKVMRKALRDERSALGIERVLFLDCT